MAAPLGRTFLARPRGQIRKRTSSRGPHVKRRAGGRILAIGTPRQRNDTRGRHALIENIMTTPDGMNPARYLAAFVQAGRTLGENRIESRLETE
ncbi:hypothetical protein [Rhizobium sp. CF142]|uniref:hypothetical protein n=1 Tax=Rhizobium sp. CF142 TaxID=1144314 RepID=UPI0012F69140|nr:hypothetical protein [Rhizobium sp. CF142]